MSEYAQKGMSSTGAAGTANKSDTAALHPSRWKRVCNDTLSGPTAHMAMLSVADQAVVSATNFLTGVIIGRACTKEEFGLYMLGFTIMLFVMTVQTSLISSPYTVYSPRLKGIDHAQYTGSTIIHQLALSAIMVLALSIAGTVLTFGIGPENFAKVVWALVIAITFISLREYIRRISFANLRFKAALILDLCVAVIQIGFLLILVIFNILSVSRAYLVIGISCGIASAFWFILNIKAFSLVIIQAISQFWFNLSFGKWVLAGDIALLMSKQLYPWFLAGTHGSAATGIFAACQGFVALFNPLIFGIGNLLGPKVAHTFSKGKGKLRRMVLRTTVLLAIATSILFFLIVICGERVLVLIYGAKYTGNSTVLSLLALSFVFSTIGDPPSYGLWAMERPDINLKINLIALIVTISIGFLMVKSFGLIGVALGLISANAIAFLIRYAVFAKLTTFQLLGNLRN